MTEAAPSITALIISFNEEVHIARCIERIRPLVRRVVVVDSFSTDRTVEIAKSLGADVYQNPFTTHGAQVQWGADNTGIDTDWILRMDCDEYLEAPLLDALRTRTPSLPDDVSAIDLKLKVLFRGKFIRWGGYYRTWLTRMWRPGRARMESRWMDEKLLIERGRVERITGGDLVDENLRDIGWWTDKHNRYATLQMIDFVLREQGVVRDHDEPGAVTPAAKFKRFLRHTIYGGAPLYLRAVLYFVQRYVLRLGFLDGRRGFVWHSLHGFWFFMLMDAKIDEARMHIAAHGIDSFPDYLKSRYGITFALPQP